MTTVAVELEEQTVERLRALAAATNLSLSQLVQRLIEVRLAPPLKSEELTPNLRKAAGIAPPMSDEEVERVIDEERMKKYGGP